MTLYVGIDIHRKFHVAALIPEQTFLLKRGKKRPPWMSSPTMKVTNTRPSYQALVTAIKEAAGDEDVHVGLEPTGHHYSKPLAYYLQSEGFTVYLVDNQSSRDLKERFFRISAKNDKIDARCLAAVLYFHFTHGETLGITLPELELETLAAAINQLNNARWNVVKDITRAKNRLRQLLHANCPEIEEQMFSTWLNVAIKYPTAADLATTPVEVFQSIGVSKAKANRLIDLAQHTIGCPIADRETIHTLALHYHDLVTLRLKLEERLFARVRAHPYWPILSTFPGLREINAACIIGAIANIDYYPDKKKFRKVMGHYVQTETTGERQKRGKAGKGGNRNAKRAISLIAINQANRSPYFQRRVAAGQRHNLPAFRGKICETLWAMLYYKRVYDPDYNNPKGEES